MSVPDDADKWEEAALGYDLAEKVCDKALGPLQQLYGSEFAAVARFREWVTVMLAERFGNH
jgi:hypothetical protein